MDRNGGRHVSAAARPLSPQMSWSSQHHPQDVFRSNRCVSLPPYHSGEPNTPTPSRERAQKTTALVQPTSSLLQDLIKERRARRGSQNSTFKGLSDGISTMSEQPLPRDEDPFSEKQKAAENAISADSRNSAPMSLRETDEYVSKITKLNFDLKLHIWHREQQVEILTRKLHRTQEIEERVQRVNQLENDVKKLRNTAKENQSLKQFNNELRRHVVKRDQAVTEAVELICQLEARIEELEAGHVSVYYTPEAAKPRGGDLAECASPHSEPKAAIDIPERRSFKERVAVSIDNSGSPKRHPLNSLSPLKREPSFLRENRKNTATLRSLCSNLSHTSLSAWSRTESSLSGEIAESTSPRLSALSECSEFLPESPTVLDRFECQTDRIRKQSPANSGRHDSEDNDSREEGWAGWQKDGNQAMSPKEGLRRVSETAHTTITEDDKLLEGSKAPRQCRGKDAVYGGLWFPPTPDTMSSAHEASTVVRDGSTTAAKRPHEAALFIEHEHGRPGSAGIVPAGPHQSIKSVASEDSNVRVNPGMGSDTSMTPCKVTHSRFDPDIVGRRPSTPSTSTASGHHHIEPTMSSYSVRDDNFVLNRESMTTPASTVRKRRFTLPAPDRYSSGKDNPSGPLATEDWLEAAKQGPTSTQQSPFLGTNNNQTGLGATDCSPTPNDYSRATNRRISSQSTPAHRHKSKLESSPRDTLEPQQRRRHWLSRLFRRSRRAEPSSCDYSYPIEEDCSAPSPVIRKTRRTHPE